MPSMFILFALFALLVRLLALVTGDVPELSDEVCPITEDEVEALFDRLLKGADDDEDAETTEDA